MMNRYCRQAARLYLMARILNREIYGIEIACHRSGTASILMYLTFQLIYSLEKSKIL